MSLFVGLHTSLSGIRAAQAGLDTVSHNIANAHTEGYTRQRVEQRARLPYLSPVGPIGTGTDVTSITRIRDRFLDARARSTAAGAAGAGTRSELLGRMEAMLDEPEGGISAALTSVWDAFEDLATRPGDVATRRGVLSSLSSLAGTVRTIASGWDQLTRDVVVRRDAAVDAVNHDLEQVAELNRQVANLPPERVGSDLLDQRDLLLDRVARATGAQVTAETDGTATVTLGTAELVRGADAGRLDRTGAAIAAGDATATPVDVTADLGGELGALHRFVTTDGPAVRGQLDDVVVTTATALNAQHAAGLDPSGATGAPLLVFDPSDPAGSLRAAVSDPSAVAAAQGTPGTPPGPNDGRNAVALAGLRTAAVSDVTDPAGTRPTSIADRLARVVVDLAADVRSSRLEADSQQGLSTTAETARQGVHGVSLDEEMVALVGYQRSLEAASRVMSAVDQALDTLVNRTGIVGR